MGSYVAKAVWKRTDASNDDAAHNKPPRISSDDAHKQINSRVSVASYPRRMACVHPGRRRLPTGRPRFASSSRASQAESAVEMAKKTIKNQRQRSKLDDPKGARRSMDAEMSYARREATGRIETTKYRAELDPKTGRKRR